MQSPGELAARTARAGGVIYQVYVRSFQDSDGDGLGDLPGLITRLDYLADLGVGTVWLSPIFTSPMRDGGYDVADYLAIDPRYGTLVDLDRLVTQAHHRGLRVVLDFVPNHTSDLHPWFVESRTSRAAARRDWYLWADPAPGGAPPNNWWNHFDGGPAWTLDEATGQYYLHLFSPHQPDLNWRNPAVEFAMTQVLRFWLDRGIDGFRVDVPSHLLKDAALRDEPPGPRWPDSWHPGVRTDDLPEVHNVLRRLRAVLDEYDGGGRVFIGELWLPSDRLVAYYGEGREFHVPLNQQLIGTPWTATQVRRRVEDYEAALPADAWPNWVLGNHDRARAASRLGPAQAKVATMALLTLRGTPVLYYGDELGLPDATVPSHLAADPQGASGQLPSRDPSRAPMPWDEGPNTGFCPPQAEPWLPTYDPHRTTGVVGQLADPSSHLALTRALLHLRREQADLRVGRYQSLDAPAGVLAYRRGDDWAMVLNLSQRRVIWRTDDAVQVALSTHLDRHELLHGAIGLRPDEGLVLRLDPGASGQVDGGIPGRATVAGMSSPGWLIDVLLRPDLTGLEELLGDEVRFRSPYADYHGREDVGHLIRLVARTLNDLRQVHDGADVAAGSRAARTTRLTATVAGQQLQGVLCEDLDTAGRLVEAMLLLRPYTGLRLAMQAMSDLLAEYPLPSTGG